MMSLKRGRILPCTGFQCNEFATTGINDDRDHLVTLFLESKLCWLILTCRASPRGGLEYPGWGYCIAAKNG